MKTKLYLYGCVLSAAILLSASGRVFSQCNCAPNVPATEIVKGPVFMAPTNASSYALFFPKFDASIGTLSCVKVVAILQGRSTGIGINNEGEAIFKWSILVSPTITLPTASVTKSFSGSFGPDTLATKRWVDSINAIHPDSLHYKDSVHHGPVDLLINESFVVNGNASAAYVGDPATNVQVNYSVFGNFFATQGNINNSASIATISSGSFYMYYYWCPAGVLAKNIRNFTTKLDDSKSTIQVKWISDNQVSGVVYEVQVSNDGVNYKTVYTQPVQSAGGSNVYQYQYNLQSGSGELIYMRIKQTDPNGKVTYTAINKVNVEDLKTGKTLGIYPNPAINNVSLQFPDEMNGDFSVDVVNLTGQTIFNKTIRINRSKTAPLDLNHAAKTGVYYLRATDKRSGATYVNKLFIQ